MARATFVKAARKAIYEKGKRVEYVSEKGKRAGQTLSKHDRTVPYDESDKVFIQKGESYYWWEFMNGGTYYSKTQPKASQLTQSNYLSQLYSIQEDIAEFSASTADDVKSAIEDFKERLKSLQEETQGSLDNMPDSLQYSPTGELLQERIDSLYNAVSEIESIDTDYEEPTLEEWIEENSYEESDEDGNELNDENENFIAWKEEKEAEWVTEKIDELQNVSID